MSIFHRHDWHYALGTSNGIISGEPREMCLRRFCPKCVQHQYVEYYNSVEDGLEGDKYYGDPVWTNGLVENDDVQ